MNIPNGGPMLSNLCVKVSFSHVHIFFFKFNSTQMLNRKLGHTLAPDVSDEFLPAVTE